MGYDWWSIFESQGNPQGSEEMDLETWMERAPTLTPGAGRLGNMDGEGTEPRVRRELPGAG